MAPIFFQVIAIFSICIAAAQSSSSINDIAPHIPDFDLDGQFVRGALSDNLKQSLDLIEKAETLSSCGKIATSALLHSCSALEGSIEHNSHLPPGSDLLVEEESDIYAARLAVCELSGADFTVPTACRSFIPAPGGRKSNTNTFRGWLSPKGASKPRAANEYYDEVTEANLKQCRKALGTSSQAWTSYSNSRQNAVAMCHAMQSAVERDESRHIAKILANTATATTESLQDAYEHVNGIKQQFHELRTAMPKFQQDLATFDDGIQKKVQEYWDHFDQLRTGVESLMPSIERAQSGMKAARVHLDAVLSSHLPGLAHAIAKASQQVSDTAENAAAASKEVAFTKQRMEQDLISRMNTAGYGLAAINDLMPQLSDVIATTINKTLMFYDDATARQLELNTAQDATMDGLERMHQKTTDANSKMDGVNAGLDSTVDKLEKVTGFMESYWAKFEFLATVAAICACSVTFGAFAFAFWHDKAHMTLVGSFAASMGSSGVFAILSCFFWNRIAALLDVLIEVSSRLSLHDWLLACAALCLIALVVAAALRYVSRPSREPSLPSDEYDPLSPPSGADAFAIRLLEHTNPRNLFAPRPASLTKSRV